MIKYKNDGLAKGGFIVMLVASIICIIACLAFLIVNNMLYAMFDVDTVELPVVTLGLTVKVFNILCDVAIGYFLILIILIIWALIRPSNGKRVFVGILSVLSIFISWAALFFPVILSLVGSVLILCGKVKKVKVVKSRRIVFDQEPQYLMHKDFE